MRPIKIGRHCSAWQMASSDCSLPQFLAYVISDSIYLKGSLKYIFSASMAFLFLLKWVFTLFLRTSRCLSHNVMCSKAPPCPPCIFFIKQNISTHKSPGEDLMQVKTWLKPFPKAIPLWTAQAPLTVLLERSISDAVWHAIKIQVPYWSSDSQTRQW